MWRFPSALSSKPVTEPMTKHGRLTTGGFWLSGGFCGQSGFGVVLHLAEHLRLDVAARVGERRRGCDGDDARAQRGERKRAAAPAAWVVARTGPSGLEHGLERLVALLPPSERP